MMMMNCTHIVDILLFLKSIDSQKKKNEREMHRHVLFICRLFVEIADYISGPTSHKKKV